MNDTLFFDICREQYTAQFQMLRRAMEHCPDPLWDERAGEPPLWQQVYHTLWATDFYLTDAPDQFRRPAFAEEGWAKLNETPRSAAARGDLQGYLEATTRKCETFLDEIAKGARALALDQKNPFGWTGPTVAHRLVYNLRHAQHHIGRINSILSRHGAKAADWICRL